MKLLLLYVIETIMLANCFAAGLWTQDRLERWLGDVSMEDDFVNFSEPEYIPLRAKDSLKEFGGYITEGHWTTNELVEGFILAATNNMKACRWSVPANREVVRGALAKLAQADNPLAQRFISSVCTNDMLILLHDEPYLLVDALSGVFARTNLEPEVFDYMRKVCVMTNNYDYIAGTMSMDLMETLKTMPDACKSSATNRLASYLYFAMAHTTQEIGFQDRRIKEIFPVYSNSVQRLNAMRYVAATATNRLERAAAQRVVTRLSAMTNLVNLSWLENP